jgi:cyclic-di-AMP phosphodiesterase PgpH
MRMNVKKQDNKISLQRKVLAACAIAFLSAFAMVVLSPQTGSIFFKDNYSDLAVGNVADRDITAPESIEYVDTVKTRELREKARAAVHPVYTVQERAVMESLNNFNRFYDLVANHEKGENLYEKTEKLFPGLFQISDINRIEENLSQFLLYLPLVEELIVEIMEKGVFESIPALEDRTFELRRWKNGEKIQEIRTISEITVYGKIGDAVRTAMAGTGIDKHSLSLIEMVVRNLTRPNVTSDPIATMEAERAAAEEIAEVTNRIAEGARIVRKGFIVTREDMEKINALRTIGKGVQTGLLFGTFAYLLLIFFLGYLLIGPLLEPRWRIFQHLLLILGLWLLFFFSAHIAFLVTVDGMDTLTALFIPTSLLSMIIASMIGKKIAFLMVLLSAFSLVPFISVGKLDIMFIIFSGLGAIHVIKTSERRIDLVKGAVLITAVHILMVLLIGLLLQKTVSWFPAVLLFSVMNALVCTILNLTLLPLMEHLFNAPTVFRLIELSDMNTPLFKRMIMLAPGTYSHSVSVANMAESACRAIGANHLLARVGAYYHDIGKTENPEYFIENQTGNNKHNELKPSLSVAVIKSHVKIGIEKAKELKLPPEVVDIVGQHHGNGLIEYFYTEAVKKMANDQIVNPEEFSYTGSPPMSKEAAVVMLADTIEAATRTLKKPTIAKLDKFIWTKIMERITNRQMINCNLTFRDMEKIKQSFVQILAGHFHSRIEYPKLEEGKKE